MGEINMEAASVLAIIILIVAILVLIFYYLQSTKNPVYQNIHAQAAGFSDRVAQEEYVSNLSDKMNDFSGKLKDRVQDEEEEDHISRTDLMTQKINQIIEEQSEQVIKDWDLATNKSLDDVVEKFDLLEEDFGNYKESNDKRVDELEERVNKIDERLSDMDD